MKKIYANNLTTLSLGREGENLARKVVFDVRDLESLYGHGDVEVIHQRPGDAQPYPLAVQRNGTLVTWDVTATDTEMPAATANERYGKCELRYYAGETLAKSQIWRTWVESAMDTPSETTPPEPEKGWVDKVLEAGTSAKEAADRAEAAIVNAPKIQNGTWWTFDQDTQVYVDTGVEAQGPQGETGPQGPAGADGGYYTPSVTQTDANTMRLSFIHSKEGMPSVADTDITLPSGGSGSVTVDSTLTVSGQAADAKAVGDALAKKQDKPDIRTALDDVVVAGAQYYLGEQTAVSVVLPNDAEVGQMVTVSWYNGANAATLSITGTMLAFDYTPSANTRSEINALWDGTYWAVLGNEMEVPSDA